MKNPWKFLERKICRTSWKKLWRNFWSNSRRTIPPLVDFRCYFLEEYMAPNESLEIFFVVIVVNYRTKMFREILDEACARFFLVLWSSFENVLGDNIVNITRGELSETVNYWILRRWIVFLNGKEKFEGFQYLVIVYLVRKK